MPARDDRHPETGHATDGGLAGRDRFELGPDAADAWDTLTTRPARDLPGLRHLMSREPGTEHLCHATGCTVPVPPKMFLCKSHWFALPKAMRDDIWATYVPGQEQRKDPTSEYIDAAQRCVAYLAAREREGT
jgi:hypothetical protein